MFASIPNMLVQVLVALTLSVPGMSGLMPNGALEVIQTEYETSLDERTRLLEEIQRLEARLKSLVSRITSLKQTSSGLTARLALEELLRESKELSNDLEGLQTKLRAFDSRIAGQRTRLVDGIDIHMRELERSLATASPEKRRAIVAELNSLRGERRAYTEPLPSGPDVGDLSAALDLAQQAEAPDDLMAVADEIEDTEDQLRRRLSAIQTRLQELKQARRLVRRATSFSMEEKFFEEVDRDRVIARYERTSVSQDDGNKAGPTSGNNSALGAANEDAVVTAGAPAEDDGFQSANNASESAADFDSAAAPEVARSPEVTDSSASPPAFDESGSGANYDVFSEVRETVVINSGGDPARSVAGDNSPRDASLDARIRALEDEEKNLSEQVKRLGKRAKELRRRASEM